MCKNSPRAGPEVCAASKRSVASGTRPRPHTASVLLLLLAARRVRRLARRMAFVIACTPTVAWPERRIGVGHWSSHPET